MVESTLITGLIVIACVYYIFNPYMAFKPRTTQELWTTREKSHGHPFYWKLRYCPDQYARHPEVYNRPHKKRCYFRNVMYLE